MPSSGEPDAIDQHTLQLRIESQDAWIYQPPISELVIAQSTFHVGAPRCDNVLAALFTAAGCEVINPAFAIRATEIESRSRVASMYGHEGSAFGKGKFVFISDKFVF